MERLRDASGKVSGPELAGALKTLIGEEGMKGAILMMNSLDKGVERQERGKRGPEIQNKAVGILRKDEFAADKRTEIDTQVALLQTKATRGSLTKAQVQGELQAAYATLNAKAHDRGVRNALTAEKAAIDGFIAVRDTLSLDPAGIAGGESIRKAISDALGMPDGDFPLRREFARRIKKRFDEMPARPAELPELEPEKAQPKRLRAMGLDGPKGTGQASGIDKSVVDFRMGANKRSRQLEEIREYVRTGGDLRTITPPAPVHEDIVRVPRPGDRPFGFRAEHAEPRLDIPLRKPPAAARPLESASAEPIGGLLKQQLNATQQLLEETRGKHASDRARKPSQQAAAARRQDQ
jgi:hypothetical protein